MLIPSVNSYQVVFIACSIFITSLMAGALTEASNSFTPITCYDCSSSSSASYSSPYPTNKNDDITSRRGQYVGSVMAAPLDENVLLNGDSKYSKPYDPQTSSFLSVAGGYSASSQASAPKSVDSTNTKVYDSNQYQKKSSIKERYHPTTFDGSQSLFRRPANNLVGSILGNVAGAIRGRLPGNTAFRDPGGGFGGAGTGTFRSPGGDSGGGLPGNTPFGSPGSGFGGGGFPGSAAFGTPGSGPGGGGPGSIPFGTPGSALAGGLPGGATFGSPTAGPNGSPFGSPGSFFGGGVQGNGFFGRPENGLGGNIPGNPTFGSPPNLGGFTGNPANPLGSSSFGAPGLGFPGGIQGNPGFGSSGAGLPPGSSSEGGTHGVLGQQVIGEHEPESGVGEVMLPAQTEFKPEVVQSTNNDASYRPPQQPGNYGYGYPPSLYGQPLPDITETPVANPTGIINESPPPLIVDKPTGVVAAGGPVRPPPPVPVAISPPIYGYYYIGRKAWYIPLYFCVYFILYVGCLILKHLYRHKAHFPEKLHDAVVNAREKNDRLNSLTETFLTAIDKYKSLI